MIAFTDEDNEEAMLKAFELFALCMAAGPCNNCMFYDKRLPEDPCTIGCPNSWALFDPYFEKGCENRKIVLDVLRRKEMKNE